MQPHAHGSPQNAVYDASVAARFAVWGNASVIGDGGVVAREMRLGVLSHLGGHLSALFRDPRLEGVRE